MKSFYEKENKENLSLTLHLVTHLSHESDQKHLKRQHSEKIA